jgi:hypothetical protein
MFRCRSILFAIPLWLSICGTALCQDFELTRATLAGIKEMAVVVDVEGSSDDVAASDLTKEMLQTDVGLRLRKAGLKVVTNSEYHLFINVHVIRAKTAPIASYSVRFEFEQSIEIPRLSKAAFATTWSIALLGLTRTSDIRAAVRDDVADGTDRFMNAYLSVNPK